MARTPRPGTRSATTRLGAYADDILTVVRGLDLRDVVLVGHSVSAMTGVLAAVAEPDLFAALVLIGPSPRYLDDGDYRGGFGEADIADLLASLDSNYLGWSTAMAPVIMGNSDRPALGEELTASFCRMDPAVARQFARVTFLSDCRAALPAVTTPTLVLQCQQDAIAPVEVGQYVARRDPRCPDGAARRHRPLPPPERPGRHHRRHPRVPPVRGAGDDMTVAESGAGVRPGRRTGARAAFLDALVHDDPVALYESAPCGFLTTTPDGVIVKTNATFRTWVRREAAELVGVASFTDLLTVGSRIYHETHFAPMLMMQDQVQEVALELVRPDGTRLPVLVNASLARGEDGRPRAVRIAVFDATERRRYERELLDAKERAEASEREARTLARTLQQTLIPPAEPKIPGLDLAAAYHPAGHGAEVGGDFYDVFPVGDGRLGGHARRRLRQGVRRRHRHRARAPHDPRAERRRPPPVRGAQGARRGAAPPRDRPVLHGRADAAAPGRRGLAGHRRRRRAPAPAAAASRPGRPSRAADAARSWASSTTRPSRTVRCGSARATWCCSTPMASSRVAEGASCSARTGCSAAVKRAGRPPGRAGGRA